MGKEKEEKTKERGREQDSPDAPNQ